MSVPFRPWSSYVAAALAVAAAAAQDSLQLKDGRFVSGPKMSRAPEGIVIHLEAGDVTVPKDLVKAAAASGTKAGADAEPTPEAKKNLAKGLVEFEGKWVRPDVRDAELKKRNAQIQKRLAEAMAHSEWAKHYTSESKYFLFEYTIDPEIMKGWADLMDEYYRVFTSFWKVKRPEGFGKLPVRFHHNQEKFYEVAGVPEGVGGYFRFYPFDQIELQFYYDRNDPDWTMNVMFHEANHYLVFLIDPKFHYPPWLSEGLAEYYGASVWDPKAKKLDVGGLLEGRVAQVQQDVTEGTWRTLDELIQQPHPIGGEYYGWAWTFVHFMMNSKYKNAFHRFVTGLAHDETLQLDTFQGTTIRYAPPAEIANAFKRELRVKDLKEIEKDWHGYIKNLKPSTARGYYVFGRTALMNSPPMPIKARRMLEMAIEKGYDKPLVYLYYARALTMVPTKNAEDKRKNLEAAKAQLEKVVAADPVHPLFRIEYARALDRLARHVRKADPEVERQLKLARELGDCAEGGLWSYDVFQRSQWTPYAGEGD
jgi:hypothetical protein